jgi:hypothetical protein
MIFCAVPLETAPTQTLRGQQHDDDDNDGVQGQSSFQELLAQ